MPYKTSVREWITNNRETAETIAHLVSIARGTPHLVTECGGLSDQFVITPKTGDEQPRLTYSEIEEVKGFFGAAFSVCDVVGHSPDQKIHGPQLETLGCCGHVAFA